MKNKLLTGKFLLVLIISIATFFINNRVVIPDIMESRNIVTAREMVYDGNWMVPTMNGELRLEKPPLPTWIAAVAEIISPDNIELQRAMAGLAAVMLMIFFYLIAVNLVKNQSFAFVSTLILCTSYNVILIARTASWDIFCHAFMLGAIYFMIKGFQDRKSNTSFLWAGLFMGLSFMSKGPVSFYALLLPFIISYTLCYRPLMKGKWKYIGWMMLICIIVGGWWYGYIYMFEHDAMNYVANKESNSWLNRSVRPWYYYWKFFLETGIWSLALITAILLPFRNRDIRSKVEFMFPYMWMFVTLILLSCLPEKKNRYLLPILISASYVTGYLFYYWEEKLRSYRKSDFDKFLFRLNAWLIALIVISLPILGYVFVYRNGYISLPALILISVGIEAVAWWIIKSAVNLRPFGMVEGVVVLFLILECFALPFMENIINNPEINSISKTREMKELKDIPFYYNSKDELRIEIVYAAGRKIRPLDVSNKDSVLSKLPFVLLTHKEVKDEVDATVLNKIDTEAICASDDNRWSKKDKRYKETFVYNITLLKNK